MDIPYISDLYTSPIGNYSVTSDTTTEGISHSIKVASRKKQTRLLLTKAPKEEILQVLLDKGYSLRVKQFVIPGSGPSYDRWDLVQEVAKDMEWSRPSPSYQKEHPEWMSDLDVELGDISFGWPLKEAIIRCLQEQSEILICW